jgi:hypothetical protein
VAQTNCRIDRLLAFLSGVSRRAVVLVLLAVASPLYATVAVRLAGDHLAGPVEHLGKVWFVTDDGSLHETDDKGARVVARLLREEPVEMAADQNDLYLEQDSLLRLVDGRLVPVSVPGSVRHLVSDRHGVLAVMFEPPNDTLYRLKGSTFVPVGEIVMSSGPVADSASDYFQVFNGTAYLVADGVLSRIGPDGKKELITKLRGHAMLSALPNESELWVYEEDAELRLTNDGKLFRSRSRLPADVVGTTPGRVWSRDVRGTVVMEGMTTRIVPVDGWLVAIAHFNGADWLATVADTVYRYDSDGLRPVLQLYDHEQVPVDNLDRTGSIRSLKVVANRLWAFGRGGSWVLEGDAFRRVTFDDVNSITYVGGKTWIDAESLYRVDDVKTEVSIDEGDIVTSGMLQLKSRYVRQDGSAAYPKAPAFWAIVTADPESYRDAIANNEYENIARAGVVVKAGRRKIWYSVRDDVGNTFSGTRELIVIPGAAAWPFVLWMFAASAAAVVFVLSPVSDTCQSLLFNPWVRRIGSLGFIPLLVSVLPPARRYLLRRYRRALRRELESEAKAFIPPASAPVVDDFMQLLGRHKRVALIGRSGIGKTAYLRYLAYHLAAKGKRIPVYVPLSRYRGVPLIDAVVSQIATLGGMGGGDRELLEWFVTQETFVILFDGLNEVDAATRERFAAFAAALPLSASTAIVCSSQENYAELSTFELVAYAPLDEAAIGKFLAARVPDIDPAVITEVFAASDIYQLPQNLEVAADLIRRGEPLPQSVAGLYRAVMAPIIASWRSADVPDYPERLFARAFAMLRDRDPYLDGKDVQLPGSLINDLERPKLIVRRDGHALFRHELIRAYLAAEHLKPRWRDVIKEQRGLDANWLPALEILSDSVADDDLFNLLEMVLKRGADLARSLYRRVKHRGRPFAWDGKFHEAYGGIALTLPNGD